MFEQALSEDLQSNLEILGKEEFCKPFYLAGGTAVALHLGHRFSFDLDFFSPQSFPFKKVSQRLKKLGKYIPEDEKENTIVGNFNNNRISFFTYEYPLLFPTQNFLGVKIADLKDIACMKLEAIGGRGRKRDFIDLFAICQTGLSLEQVFDLYEEKYKGEEYSLVHLTKALSYFEDAEGDEMPKMIKRIKWSEVKKFFTKEAKEIAKGFTKT